MSIVTRLAPPPSAGTLLLLVPLSHPSSSSTILPWCPISHEERSLGSWLSIASITTSLFTLKVFFFLGAFLGFLGFRYRCCCCRRHSAFPLLSGETWLFLPFHSLDKPYDCDTHSEISHRLTLDISSHRCRRGALQIQLYQLHPFRATPASMRSDR
ncbi:hypothetical protein B0J13DRAFT_10054 [Dactylonectria estremocensis]|uniref:Uncharacterized protein n=1 Tax=Dactylonectria estremocensis TaxID=1079267 RepID=A0A9P9FIJ2_9HYPO|nr:hypothetical protein B0J13DRAFT_10054 [Dactylonectria estremocensis]